MKKSWSLSQQGHCCHFWMGQFLGYSVLQYVSASVGQNGIRTTVPPSHYDNQNNPKGFQSPQVRCSVVVCLGVVQTQP